MGCGSSKESAAESSALTQPYAKASNSSNTFGDAGNTSPSHSRDSGEYSMSSNNTDSGGDRPLSIFNAITSRKFGTLKRTYNDASQDTMVLRDALQYIGLDKVLLSRIDVMNIREFVADPVLLGMFVVFAHERFAEENIFFVKDMKTMRDLFRVVLDGGAAASDKQEQAAAVEGGGNIRSRFVAAVLHEYFKPGAPMEINIPGRCRTRVLSAAAPALSVFVEAEIEVFNSLSDSGFVEDFRKWLQQTVPVDQLAYQLSGTQKSRKLRVVVVGSGIGAAYLVRRIQASTSMAVALTYVTLADFLELETFAALNLATGKFRDSTLVPLNTYLQASPATSATSAAGASNAGGAGDAGKGKGKARTPLPVSSSTTRVVHGQPRALRARNIIVGSDYLEYDLAIVCMARTESLAPFASGRIATVSGAAAGAGESLAGGAVTGETGDGALFRKERRMVNVKKQQLAVSRELEDSQSVLVVGGGKSGVSLAAELKAQFPAKAVTLVEAGSELMACLPGAHALAHKHLTETLGVRVVLDERVVAVDGTVCMTQRGTRLEGHDYVVACAGARANDDFLIGEFWDKMDPVTGLLKVDPYLRVGKRMFVLGDSIWRAGADAPCRGDAAIAQADLMVRNLERIAARQTLFAERGAAATLNLLAAEAKKANKQAADKGKAKAKGDASPSAPVSGSRNMVVGDDDRISLVADGVDLVRDDELEAFSAGAAPAPRKTVVALGKDHAIVWASAADVTLAATGADTLLAQTAETLLAL